MNSFKNLFFIIFLLSVTISFAADHDQQKLKDQVNEIVQEIQSGDQMASKDENQEEEVPLNDPFAGNEGNTRNAMMAGVDEEEAQDENSLYNFKLVGLISGKDHSYISLANSSGEVITVSYTHLTLPTKA